MSKFTYKTIGNLSRESLIDLLEWNDHNGCYNDDDSILEFGSIATYDDLLQCAKDQELHDGNLDGIPENIFYTDDVMSRCIKRINGSKK